MPSTYIPLVALDRFTSTLHAQLLSTQTVGTFQGDNATANGSQLVSSPAGYYAVVTIENEKILCTYTVAGNVVTFTIVQRGYDGTTAATHNITPSAPAIEMHWTKIHNENVNAVVLDHDQKVYGTVAGSGFMNGVIPQGTVTTIASATSHTIAGDQTAIFTVGRVYLFQRSGVWYRAVISAVSYSNPTTTITLAGDGLPSSGTVTACGFEMGPSVDAVTTLKLIKYMAADPAVNPPSGYFWFYSKSGGFYYMDSSGNVVQFLTGVGTDPQASLVAGENISAGQAVYVKASDGKAYKAVATADESTYSWVGVASNTVTTGQTVTYWKPGAIATGVGTGTIGDTAFITDTAGTIGTTPGTRYASIGIYRTTTSIELRAPHFIRSGTQSITSGTTFVQTTGFYPKKISIIAASTSTNVAGSSEGSDANFCVAQRLRSASNDAIFRASDAWYVHDANGPTLINAGTVSAKSQTGFTLNCTSYGNTVTVGWVAEN